MKSKMKLSSTILPAVYLLPIAMLFTCGQKNKNKTDPGAPPPNDQTKEQVPTDLILDPETQKWWTDRVNYALRLADPLENLPDAQTLSQKKPKDVVAAIMNDESFYDMMTDFTMYWLGIKGPGLFEYDYETSAPRKAIRQSVAENFQVINAVKSMASHGNYFTHLFQEKGPLIFYSNSSPYSGPTTPGQPNPTPAQIRAKILEDAKAKIPAIIPLLKEETKTEACDAYDDLDVDYRLGGPNDFFDFSVNIDPLLLWCAIENAPIPADPVKLMDDKIKMMEVTINEFNAIDQRLGGRSPRMVDHVTDLEALSLSTGPVIRKQYNTNFFVKIPNSSTNRNRKRAAWALKRFFCDDLTPINVEIPSSHDTGAHGSSPACYSCHYKLDPMAGYFRELGFFGTSFADSNSIFFDDGATMQRSEYEQPWKAPPETGRPWNIGYVRSSTDDKLNTYGSNFSDFFQLLQTAPEVKECFVRRAFEYIVGENQTVDRGWLKSVTARMAKTEKTSTTDAIKGVFSDIVMSKAFLTRDRNNNECYDLPAGTTSRNRAPCQIANILERNCASCHSAASSLGGLDLTSWKIQSDGKLGFTHISQGQQLTHGASMQKILDRLATTDQTKRMPLMKTIAPQDLETLYLWLQKEISK